MESFGNKLFQKVYRTKGILYLQGELTQLIYIAFEKNIQAIKDSEESEIPLKYPIGFRNGAPLFSTYTYTKQDLLNRYDYLTFEQVPKNGLYQFVTLIEALLGDILYEVLLEYPHKISSKKKFDIELVFNSISISEVKQSILNTVINELKYLSPKDFAVEFQKYVGIDLLKEDAFHKYVEAKSTRDIHIHNNGIANDIYVAKAGNSARVKVGEELPIDPEYFLMCYDSCLEIATILEDSLNKIWPSQDYNDLKQILNNKNKSREEIIREGELLDKEFKSRKGN